MAASARAYISLYPVHGLTEIWWAVTIRIDYPSLARHVMVAARPGDILREGPRPSDLKRKT